MFLISLLLVSLIVFAIVTEDKSVTVEQEEFITIPLRVNEAEGSRKLR